MAGNCPHHLAWQCLRVVLGTPSRWTVRWIVIWIYSLWTAISTVPESRSTAADQARLACSGTPVPGNTVGGGGRQSRSGTDWSPDEQP